MTANESNILRLDNKLYHEQYYEDGSLCELNNKPRRTTIKFFCDEMTLNHIDSINEIETCVYEIHIHASSLCSIRNFNKKFQSSNIKCNPVLNSKDYENYVTSRAAEMKDLLTKQESKETMLEEEPAAETSNDLIFDQLDEDYMNNAEKIKDLQEKTQYYENLLKSTNVNDEINLVDEIKSTELELMKSADNILKTNEVLKKLTDNLNDIIDNLEMDDENLDEISENLLDSSPDTTTTTSSISDSSDNKIDSSTPEMKLKVSVVDANSNIGKDIRKLTGLDEQSDTQSRSVKSLENSIREKLMSKNSKYKNIEIKVISLDGFDAKSMNDDAINKLFSSLFGDTENKEAVSKLNKNYNLVFKDGEFVHEEEKGDEDDELFIRY